jgi:rhomboid protease GluP
MPSQAETPPETDQPPTAPEAVAPATEKPWIHLLSVIVCVGIWVGITARGGYDSWDALARFGYLPAEDSWAGAYWGLVTSAFVHIEAWHLAFNAYWLWTLGRQLERAIGSFPMLGFIVASAAVSSSFELALSGSTGIGASGVVYAIFGFMWRTRHRYPGFADVLNAGTVQLFLLWLVGCIIATLLEIANIGNAAHMSGLLFGALAAHAFPLPRHRLAARAGLAALVVASAVPLFWAPWSVGWLSHSAYQCHAARHLGKALHRYDQIIARDPDNAWAHLNRSFVHAELGNAARAEADLARARELDPTIAD